MTNKRLVNKIAKVGVGAAMCLMPILSNGQKVKEDINWTKQNAPYEKYTLSIRSIHPLVELSKYQTYAKQSYLPYGNLNLPYKYNYTIPQDSIKGDVSKYLKLIDVCPDCTKQKKPVPVKKKTPVKKPTTPAKTIPAKKPIDTPTKDTPTKPTVSVVPQETPKKQENEEPVSNYSQTIINKDSHDTYNYFYGDTTKVKQEQQKLSTLELRVLIEGSKNINPIESPFWGATGAIQLGKGSVWAGPYATIGFGKDIGSSSTPVYHETLLNQPLQLFTVTEGIRNESAELAYPVEFGGLLSVGSKDQRVQVNLGYGVVKEKTSTNDVVETGHDWITQNGSVVGEKKPYSITLKDGVNTDKYVPTQKVGVDVHPFKKSGFYIGAEAQHRGKVNSKMDRINYNVKAGWMFGGRKR